MYLMTMQKNNRLKEYVLELEVCKEHLFKNDWGTPPLQRRFWMKRESLIKKKVEIAQKSAHMRSPSNDVQAPPEAHE